jgi:type IV secretory pathway component VirB8
MQNLSNLFNPKKITDSDFPIGRRYLSVYLIFLISEIPSIIAIITFFSVIKILNIILFYFSLIVVNFLLGLYLSVKLDLYRNKLLDDKKSLFYELKLDKSLIEKKFTKYSNMTFIILYVIAVIIVLLLNPDILKIIFPRK